MEDNKLNINTGKSGSVGDSSSSVFQCPSFRCAYGPVKRFYMPQCEKEVDEYEKKVDKNGVVSFVITGHKVNIYEEIQSYADDTDINVIISRCIQENGNIDSLRAQIQQMQDVSDLPDTFLGIYNYSLDCQRAFEKMPAEFKEKFDNSFLKFTDDIIHGKAYDKIKTKDEEKAELKVEVKNVDKVEDKADNGGNK